MPDFLSRKSVTKCAVLLLKMRGYVDTEKAISTTDSVGDTQNMTLECMLKINCNFCHACNKMTQNIGERRGSFLQNTRPLEALTDEALNNAKLAWADFEF